MQSTRSTFSSKVSRKPMTLMVSTMSANLASLPLLQKSKVTNCSACLDGLLSAREPYGSSSIPFTSKVHLRPRDSRVSIAHANTKSLVHSRALHKSLCVHAQHESLTNINRTLHYGMRGSEAIGNVVVCYLL